MLTAFFALTTIICSLGWLVRSVSTMAMSYYIFKKGYTPPSDDEMKECTQYVVKHLLKK